MDPNQLPTQPQQLQPSQNPENSALNKASQATGEYIHNNYETWLRKIFGFTFNILKFIQSTLMQMFNQIFKS